MAMIKRNQEVCVGLMVIQFNNFINPHIFIKTLNWERADVVATIPKHQLDSKLPDFGSFQVWNLPMLTYRFF